MNTLMLLLLFSVCIACDSLLLNPILSRIRLITKLFKFHQNEVTDVNTMKSPKVSPVLTPEAIESNDQSKNQNAYSTSSTVAELTDSSFNDFILERDGLKAILFTTNWAAPCKAMSSNFMKASLPSYQLTDTKFYQINTDSNPVSASTFNVRSVPCVLIFQDSKVVAEIVGTVPAQVISDYLNKNFGPEDHFQ